MSEQEKGMVKEAVKSSLIVGGAFGFFGWGVASLMGDEVSRIVALLFGGVCFICGFLLSLVTTLEVDEWR